jgi:parallel beta-helix repeat protein
VQIALVTRTGAALDAYRRFFEAQGIDLLHLHSISELFQTLTVTITSGFVLDIQMALRRFPMNRSLAVLGMVLLISLTLLTPARPAYALRLDIVYAGGAVVDMALSDCGGKGRKCELTRNGTPVRTWTDQPDQTLYFSDTVANASVNHYVLKQFVWDDMEMQWYENLWDERTVNTADTGGALYNGADNPYGRTPVSWQGDIHISSLGVEVASGVLAIGAGSEVVMDGGLFSRSGSPGSGLIAQGVHFLKGGKIASAPALLLHHPAAPIRDCQFEGVHVTVENGGGPDISGNAFVDATLTLNGTTAATVAHNRGVGDSALYINLNGAGGSATHNTVEDNDFGNIHVRGAEDILRGNRAAGMILWGAGNLAEKNSSSRFILEGSDNRLAYNIIENLPRTTDLFNPFNGALRLSNSSRNEIIGNTIRGNGTDGILLTRDSNDNVITGNVIERNQGAGITIGGGQQATVNAAYGAGNLIGRNLVMANQKQGILLMNAPANRVEENVIEGNGDAGVEINTEYHVLVTLHTSSAGNLVRGNSINGSGDEGILIKGADSSNNEIVDNIVERSGWTGVQLAGAGNTFANNIVRQSPQGRNARDGGVDNIWNREKSAGPNITGGPYLGGNYWDDYRGEDANRDGLGETPYPIHDAAGQVAAEDGLPLVSPRVNATGDADDKDPTDTVCDTGATIMRGGVAEPECTLRAAITQANARAGEDTIFFDIPGAALPEIRPHRGLPVITGRLRIDGTSQPGSGKVKLVGSGVATSGLEVKADGAVRLNGLIVTGFGGDGIRVAAGAGSGISLASCEFTGNGGWGVYNDAGIEADSLLLRHIAVNHNGAGGIFTSNGIAIGSTDVAVRENGGYGVYNEGKGGYGGVTLTESTIIGNQGPGIFSLATLNGVQFGGSPAGRARIGENGGNGIYSEGDVTAVNSDISDNRGWGIYGAGGDGVFLKNVAVTGNTAGGVYSANGLGRGENLDISGNLGNGIHTLSDGVRTGVGSAVTLGQAAIHGNSGDGIYATQGNLLLNGVLLHHNAGSGIRVIAGDLEGREIVANRNGADGITVASDLRLTGGEACRNTGADLVAGGQTRLADFTTAGECPNVDFSAGPATGEAPLTVQFTDLSGGDMLSWLWNFGDGGASVERNPAHTYNAAGTYSVSLTAADATGEMMEIKPAYIRVGQAPAPPVADFSASPLAGEAPLTVAFTDLSTGAITARAWDFGDGGASAERHPVHAYLLPGSYTVTLTVSGPDGSDMVTQSRYLLATPLRGELNGDGFADLADAILGLRLMNRMEMDDFRATALDIDGDSKIGMAEVIFILQRAAGMR